MAGLYIHIPFCKQACNYCNFHFATSLGQKNELLKALLNEISLRQNYLKGEIIETIYLGGGTPSLLEAGEISSILQKARATHAISPNAEITLEANPDDMGLEALEGWKEAGVNRLSVGVQSFFEEHLKWMNRAHNAGQAIESIRNAQKTGFENFSIDLIYGIPGLSDEQWKRNVDLTIEFGIPHISCYALTVEPKTPLQKMIREHRAAPVDPDQQAAQFLQLMDWLSDAGYEHYEISNFAKPGFRSRHNSNYWETGKIYCGIGPSAHSFDGSSRQWNVANNRQYIDQLKNGIIPFEKEELTPAQRLNEYVMTSLRTMEGLDMRIASTILSSPLEIISQPYIQKGWMVREDAYLKLTREGKLMADGIAAGLFV